MNIKFGGGAYEDIHKETTLDCSCSGPRKVVVHLLVSSAVPCPPPQQCPCLDVAPGGGMIERFRWLVSAKPKFVCAIILSR